MAEFLKTCSLSSGSSGNAIYVGFGGTNILIDAGRNSKALCGLLEEIGEKPQDLNAIFITHEHIDHVNALKVFVKKYKTPVYMVWECYNELDEEYKNALAGSINFIKTRDKINLGRLEILSFETPHDSASSVGYVVKIDEKKAVGIATDIGFMSKEIVDSIIGCGVLYIESNHDIDMLKRGGYPLDLKRRILAKTGHLSNKECAEFLPFFIQNGASKIILYHLSGENNSSELALNEAKRAILRANLGVGKVFLCVAPKSNPCEIINIEFNNSLNNNLNNVNVINAESLKIVNDELSKNIAKSKINTIENLEEA